MSIRKIRKIIKSRPVLEGAGVHLKRAIGFGEATMFDPFLLLDDFRSGKESDYIRGFPWHPHRGIETITYMLRGNVEHGDSMGNKGVISAGDIQWMTAGSGIIHQEMPKGDAQGVMNGFQLWANLPRSHKMMDPRYQEIRSSDIPEVEAGGGVRIRIICGAVGGTPGPVKDIVTEPEYLDITVPAGCEYTHPVKKGHTALAYVIGGKCYFCNERKPFAHDAEGVNYFDFTQEPFVANETLVHFGDGDSVLVATGTEPARFLLISGRPIGEPVAWYGPIVMNTQDELRVAFEEYQAGTFIKHK
ncbi:MAG: pirin family protein [Spirochaetes bacterium]|nr:MAG: pirin family protein [Spirochaetota bacterium]